MTPPHMTGWPRRDGSYKMDQLSKSRSSPRASSLITSIVGSQTCLHNSHEHCPVPCFDLHTKFQSTMFTTESLLVIRALCCTHEELGTFSVSSRVTIALSNAPSATQPNPPAPNLPFALSVIDKFQASHASRRYLFTGLLSSPSKASLTCRTKTPVDSLNFEIFSFRIRGWGVFCVIVPIIISSSDNGLALR